MGSDFESGRGGGASESELRRRHSGYVRTEWEVGGRLIRQGLQMGQK